jgi:hypothetical protein
LECHASASSASEKHADSRPSVHRVVLYGAALFSFAISLLASIIFFACFKPETVNNKLSLTLTTVFAKKNKNQKFVTTTLKTKKRQLTIIMSGKGKDYDDE